MITIEKPVSTKALTRAIELRCSPVLGSLNMMNALGGADTDEWRLVRAFTLSQLIDEAVERGVDLVALVAACCDVLVVDTPPFRHAVGYDPRPRCGLCARRHFQRRDGGIPLSCGDSARFRNEMPSSWTRTTAVEAVEGRYAP